MAREYTLEKIERIENGAIFHILINIHTNVNIEDV